MIMIVPAWRKYLWEMVTKMLQDFSICWFLLLFVLITLKMEIGGEKDPQEIELKVFLDWCSEK